MHYTNAVEVDGSFDDVVETTTSALSEEGFGVLCDIDVQATFAEKLDEAFRQYRILGACNPALAKQALTEELGLGALLPCNVVVYEADDGTIAVNAVDPEQLVGIAENPALEPIATDVADRFERVLATVRDEFEAGESA